MTWQPSATVSIHVAVSVRGVQARHDKEQDQEYLLRPLQDEWYLDLRQTNAYTLVRDILVGERVVFL